jgi:hypothetical protein
MAKPDIAVFSSLHQETADDAMPPSPTMGMNGEMWCVLDENNTVLVQTLSTRISGTVALLELVRESSREYGWRLKHELRILHQIQTLK